MNIYCECKKCVLCSIVDNNICENCERTLRNCNCSLEKIEDKLKERKE